MDAPEHKGPRLQGWKQFLSNKHEMVKQYDLARLQASGHVVQVHHGKVGEACFRKWLSEFLPKRFGVSPGYLVSQGVGVQKVLSHFDVIVYDRLQSPVLWVETNPDASDSGQARAFPCEYVHAVLEVKASLSTRTAEEAISKLGELAPLLEKVDTTQEPYKKYLPPSFVTGCVFFELRKEHEYDHKAIEVLMNATALRGFYGATILRGEGLHPDSAAKLMISLVNDSASRGERKKANQSLFDNGTFIPAVLTGQQVEGMLLWSSASFSMFAFDLVALLNGSYRPGFISSFHGLPM